MTYTAPVLSMLHTMRHVAGLESILPDEELVSAVLEEAGKFAATKIAPLNHSADKEGAHCVNGVVTMPKGFKALYQDWVESGWNGLTATPDFGGQGLPMLVNAACTEMWNAASGAFGLGPLLTQGAIEALSAHGTQDLKGLYLEKLITGQWTGTMNLTEPQSGSDLTGLRTKAVKQLDGSYKIEGQKIFITWGEHDCAENIIHLVLARLPDAPAGTKGISLFLVPKFLVNADGSLGERNDVRCHSLEHKLGVHGSPTCTMIFGDAGGATGFLLGQENKGLNCMFTMMNNARLNVALQGVGVAERATQQAQAFAQERKQGKASGYAGEGMAPIIHHPDVKRMLLTMQALTAASRAICYRTAAALDGGHSGDAQAAALGALLTPVAKAFSTDNGIEVANIGVQIHGGMGFIEETGAAQHLRDARIYAIYEGTNGIHAIDLVTRKLSLNGGQTIRAEIARHKGVLARIEAAALPVYSVSEFKTALDAFERCTDFMHKAQSDVALAGANSYLRIFGLVAGASALFEEALADMNDKEALADIQEALADVNDKTLADQPRLPLARFMAEHLLTAAEGLAKGIENGAESILLMKVN